MIMNQEFVVLDLFLYEIISALIKNMSSEFFRRPQSIYELERCVPIARNNMFIAAGQPFRKHCRRRVVVGRTLKGATPALSPSLSSPLSSAAERRLLLLLAQFGRERRAERNQRSEIPLPSLCEREREKERELGYSLKSAGKLWWDISPYPVLLQEHKHRV